MREQCQATKLMLLGHIEGGAVTVTSTLSVNSPSVWSCDGHLDIVCQLSLSLASTVVTIGIVFFGNKWIINFKWGIATHAI